MFANSQLIPQLTQPLWEALAGKRIFLTGGTGFVGTNLLESFIQANKKESLGIQITILSRSPQSYKEKNPLVCSHSGISFCEGDIRDFEFPSEKYDIVIHAATAASAKLNAEAPFLMFDTILSGTKRALDFAAKCHASKFLFVSSGAVYGQQPVDMLAVSEECLQAPRFNDVRSAYGMGKLAAEHLCCLSALRYGFEVGIARCFAFVGPWLPWDIHFAIGNFIRDALKGQVIRVQGDGTPLRTWLYAAELPRWLLTILLKGKSLEPYNVGSDEIFSIADAAKLVAKLATNVVQVDIAKQPVSGQLPVRYVPDITRARDMLGLIPQVDLKESIQLSLNWYKKNWSH